MSHPNATPQPPVAWDAIVIGSGMGGLTFASLYAQLAKKKVLLLERHYVPGGFTHSFARDGFRWDVGLHYVGAMAPASPSRRLMDMVTGGKVQWQALPDAFDVYHYPGLRLSAFSAPERYAAAVCEQFPTEAPAIQRYFADLAATAKALGPQVWSWSLPAWISAPMRFFGRRAAALSTLTVAEYMQQHFKDPRLIAALTSHWGDYGLPPHQASFGTHAMITASYFGGAFFPVGGAERIAAAALQVVRQHGGDCLVNQKVDRILVENGAAVGVQVGGNLSRAPLVISNAGAATTLGPLLGQAAPPSATAASSAVTLYLGLRESPASLGMQGENHWVHENFSHVPSASIDSVFLSFSSLNNPKARKHTAQVMAIVDASLFRSWQGTSWQQRGPDYQAFKEALSLRLLALAEKAVPGLAQLVEYQELSTPLSVEHFTGSTSIYGSPGDVRRFRERNPTVRTEIRNLLLTGADACCLGIQGSLMGGVFAAAYALHPLLGFPRIMRASQNSH